MTGWDACNGVVLLSFRLSPDDNRDAWRNPLEMMIIVLITRERDSSTLRLRRIARNDIRRKEIPRLANARSE